MARKALVLVGVCMSVAGGLGFFTYADDLRQTGELAAAFGLLFAGIGLLASAFQPTLPLQQFIQAEAASRLGLIQALGCS